MILEIGHLKKLGFLDGRTKVSEVDVGERIWVRHKAAQELVVSVPKYSSEDVISVSPSDERFWTSHLVRFVSRELKFGLRPYFVCPVTEDDCLKLVFYRGLVSSMVAFKLIKANPRLSANAIKYEAGRAKLLKYDGTLRRSEDERERLITFLRKQPRRLSDDEKIVEFLVREERRKARYHNKFLWEARDLSTTKGLDCGLGASQHSAFHQYMSKPLEWLENIPPVTGPAERPPQDSIEHYPQLNIRILLERGHFDSDRVTGIRLGWPLEATDTRSIYLFFDPRPDGMPLLIARIERRDSAGVIWQNIRLLPSSRSDRPRYALCPLTHIRSDLLYFRNGIFASREAQGLYNPSQRAAGRKRCS